MPLPARITAALAVIATAGTFVAAQIDFVRRHRPGIPPDRYVVPQITHIWLPGLGLALALGVTAFVLARKR